MDWTERIQGSTPALADLVGAGDPDAPVATCPDWSLRDLGWHLLEVQSFWTWIIENRPDGPDEYTQGTRPGDDALPDAIRATCAGLLRSLEAADPLEAAWSWSDDHTVGFTLRRQAHDPYTQRVNEPSPSMVRADASTLDLRLRGRAGFEMVEIEGDADDAVRLRQIATSGSQ